MGIWNRIHLVLVTLLIASGFFLSPIAAEEVDVELVMAVDGSGSVNPQEMELQFQGYIDAFRNPVIQNAMRSGPTGKVAVALVVWSDRYLPKLQTEWFRIASTQDAEEFALALQSLHQQVKIIYATKGGTEIGAGIGYSLAMMEQNEFTGLKKIIDVSGDGIETRPYSNSVMRLPQAILIANSRQVIINGLAITNDFYNLERYYRENVISGPGSFVIKAKDFHHFGEAIHRKLLREFSSQVSHLRQ